MARPQPSELARANLDNNREMLAAEAAMLIALFTVVSGLLFQVGRSGGSPTTVIERLSLQIELSIARVVFSSRIKSRMFARSGLRTQLDAIAKMVGDVFTIGAPVANPADLIAARRAARHIRKRLVKIGAKLVHDDAGATTRHTLEELSTKLQPSLETVAAYESSEAFNDERSRAVRETKTTSGVVTGVLFVREWSADMDRRTCPICEQLHGTIVLPSQGFPSGDPPIHGYCRCTDYLLPITLLYPFEIEELQQVG